MKKLKNLFLKLLVFLTILVIVFVSLILFIRIQEAHYMKQFQQIKNGSSISMVEQKWGKADSNFSNANYGSDKRILYYKKGVLGWRTYVFIFTKQDSILVNKVIDD